MKQIITSALYLLVIFLVSRYIFEPTHLYYELKWLDIPVHIMGGFGVASLAASLHGYFKKEVTFWRLFVIYLVAGISWEIYEYTRDVITYTTWDGWLDTIKDLVDGAIGAALAYFLIRK